jgi:secondary thiamine-phosphate synthase enzyme
MPGETRHTVFTIDTTGPGLVKLTELVHAFVAGSGIGGGLLTLFVRHTSCSLLVQENADPDVQTDLATFFRRLVPPARRSGERLDHPPRRGA